MMNEFGKRGAGPLAVAVLALAVIALLRVDSDVFVFALGAMCGALSVGPLSVLITAYIMHQRAERDRHERRRYQREQSPVVVVTGGAAQPVHQLPYPAQEPGYALDAPFAPAQRQFTVIGDETAEGGV